MRTLLAKFILTHNKVCLALQLNTSTLDTVLHALGDLLAAEGETVRLIVVGGAALSLLGLVDRTTADVDVIAQANVEAPPTTPLPPEPLPEALTRAAATVARDFGLPPNWLNTEIAAQWRTGLPPGLTDDLTWRRYGGLHLGLVSRRTLLMLKLFAAVDRGPRSVHFQDLLALRPSAEELEAAAVWVRTQDANPDFAALVGQVAERALRASRDDQ